MNDNQESKSLARELKIQALKEKAIGHLKTHQKLISYALIAAVLAAVLATAFSFYNQFQSKKYSAILHQSLIDEQKGDAAKATEALKTIYESSAPAGVKSIASLKYAIALSNSNQTDQAIEVYLAVNQNKKFDDYMREYAGLLAVKTLIGQDKKDNQEKITTLLTRLEKESKILKYYIIEQKGIAQWNAGDFKTAYETFKSITDNLEASEMLKKRASEMVGIYISKFGEPKVEVKKVETKEATKSEEKSNQ
jgi:hypothetical protein